MEEAASWLDREAAKEDKTEAWEAEEADLLERSEDRTEETEARLIDTCKLRDE